MSAKSTTSAWRAPSDRALSVAVFLGLGLIYLATLLPALGGTEDTPKFQYVGATLGTPHDPGYPLYMLTTWAFSKLPFGVLAYRINLLSAVWGAAGASFVFLSMRRLAVPRTIAVAIAFGLGLGRAFWEHSTFAEAYTQVSALSAATLLALLIWDEDGRDRWLFAATGAASLAFGTHLIVAGMVPAFAWFVLSRYRWRVPSRVLAIVALIVALGVAQYGYVWLRTVQHARYLEARASSLSDMAGLLTAKQFRNQTFTEPITIVASKRVPQVWAAGVTEMGTLAGIAALVGIGGLWWRRQRRTALLLAIAAIGPAALLATLGGVATDGILLPALMPAWVLSGCGLAFVWTQLASAAHTPTIRRAAVTAVALLAISVPVVQARDNVAFNNRHNDVYETTYFGSLFQMLDGPAAFIVETYTLDHMVEYERYVTGRPRTRTRVDKNPHEIAGLLESGSSVYAFTEGAAALAGRVTLRSVTLSAPSLDARLRASPRGTVVVVAGTAVRWPALATLSLGDKAPRAGRAAVVALKGIGPIVVTDAGFDGTLTWRRGDPLGTTGYKAAVDFQVDVNPLETFINVDGEPVLHTQSGLAVAEIDTGLLAEYALRPGNGLRPPLDMSRHPLYRVTGLTDADSCAALSDGQWTALRDPGRAARLAGDLLTRAPFDATWLVYLAGREPLPARLADWSGDSEPRLTVDEFSPAKDDARLRASLDADHLTPTPELFGAAIVTRLAVAVSQLNGVSRFEINLGGQPEHGWSRAGIDRRQPGRATLCIDDAEPLLPDPDTQQATVYLGAAGDFFVASGWHNPEGFPAGFHRRTGGADASLLLPIERPAPITLRLSVAARDGARTLAPSLNGRALTPAALRDGWNDLAWHVDAAGWNAGVNTLALHISSTADSRDPASPRPSLEVRRVVLDWSDAP